MAGGREGEIAGRTEKLLLGERRRGGGGDFNILEKQEGHEGREKMERGESPNNVTVKCKRDVDKKKTYECV